MAVKFDIIMDHPMGDVRRARLLTDSTGLELTSTSLERINMHIDNQNRAKALLIKTFRNHYSAKY